MNKSKTRFHRIKAVKICFVTNLCPPYRLPVFQELSKYYDLLYIFTKDGSYRGWNKYENIRYLLCLSSIKLLIKTLEVDFDIVITDFPAWYSILLYVICKIIKRRKIIFWVEEWHQPKTFKRSLLTPILRYFLVNCDAVIVPGKAAKIHVLNFGVMPSKIFQAPNASVIAEFFNLASDNNAKLGGNFNILYLGRLVRYKGADYLIKAFHILRKEMQNVRLIIVGDGDFKYELMQLVRELNVPDVKFVQKCKDEERAIYYQMCDLFVLPSIWQKKYCEAWGLVLNEAMQFSKPVITTDAVGAAYDLVKNGVNGFIVKNGDVEALYRAMQVIAKSPRLAKFMGEQSRNIIKSFTYENMVRGFINAISFVIKQTGRRVHYDA
jgi:glycosyltransferase involved in cell wall biosynthesis